MSRLGIVVWVLAALAATALLGVAGANAGRWPEWMHLLGHLVLCGGLSLGVCAIYRGSDTARAVAGFVAGLSLGAAIEIVQVGWQPGLEVLHDLALDSTGSALGVILWGHRPPERANAVGHVMSWVFHPVWLAPLALFALAYAAARDEGAAVRFALAAMGCLVPAISAWLLGWWLGWWSDPDISVRTERPALFALGMLGAVAFTGWLSGEEEVLQRLALVGTIAAALGVLATLLGLKVSGHVAIPAAIGFGMVAFSQRGPLLLFGPALVLSWARVVADRHRWFEVAAAWLLAALLGAAVGSERLFQGF